MHWAAYLGLLATVAHASTGSTITFTNSKRLLFDTDGQQIDAYGSKINYFDDTYYLYGNSFSEVGTAEGVKSYSSTDLNTWTANGNILSTNLTAYCFESLGGCGRPHIVYSSQSAQYILWLNANPNGYVIATSKSPAGPFEQAASRALIDPQFDELQPADFTVESNGTSAWLVFSALNFRDPRAGSIWPPIFQTLHISALTDDFMNTTRISYPVASGALDLIDQEAESPDFFMRDGYYYVAASNTCGYCNGSIALLYRSQSIQGPWTRQILAGDSCRGQVEGVLPLTDPSSGNISYVWHATSVPGGPRTGFGGHIFQPLEFNADGSAHELNCSADASFTVPFTPGTQSAATGAALNATDATPADVKYSYVCDSDQFDLFQTWKASKSGTLTSVSVNIARANQVVPLSLTVFNNFTSYDELTSPLFKWNVLGIASVNASELSFTFDTTKVMVNASTAAAGSGIAVKEGDYLGLAITGADYSPYCHLEYHTATTSNAEEFKLFQRGIGQNSWRGIDGKKSIVYERIGKSVKLFATYA